MPPRRSRGQKRARKATKVEPLDDKRRAVLARQLAKLAPASPLATERRKALELLRRAPDQPPSRVGRNHMRRDDA